MIKIMVDLGLELINHNRIKEIHSDKTTFSKINSKQGINKIKDSETKALVSSKRATTNNKTRDNSNSTGNNNKCMDNSNNKTNFKHTNNQTIISVDLVTIINSNRIVSKQINSRKDSKDLIISNSNNPRSNRTPIRARHLICSENAPFMIV